MVAIDKLSNRAKCERPSEIKGLRKGEVFLPKIELYLGKWKRRIQIRGSGLEIRARESGFVEDLVETARKEPPFYPRLKALPKRPTKTSGKGESSQKKPKIS